MKKRKASPLAKAEAQSNQEIADKFFDCIRSITDSEVADDDRRLRRFNKYQRLYHHITENTPGDVEGLPENLKDDMKKLEKYASENKDPPEQLLQALRATRKELYKLIGMFEKKAEDEASVNP